MQHRDRFIKKKHEKDVYYRTDRTNMSQCTERVYYRKTERMRYNAQSAYITERQNKCVTMYRKRRGYYRAIQARTRAL